MPGTWSPDSRHLLWGDGQRLKVYSVEDRQSETLFEAGVDQALLDDWLWSPNGRFIVFGLRDTASETNPAEFFIMPAAERGTPTLLARAPGGFTRFGGLRWSRDGRKILATGGGSGPARAGYEYWIMENFLPSP